MPPTEGKSETPLTDAAALIGDGRCIGYVRVNFARSLERRLIDTQNEISEVRSAGIQTLFDLRNTERKLAEAEKEAARWRTLVSAERVIFPGGTVSPLSQNGDVGLHISRRGFGRCTVYGKTLEQAVDRTIEQLANWDAAFRASETGGER